MELMFKAGDIVEVQFELTSTFKEWNNSRFRVLEDFPKGKHGKNLRIEIMYLPSPSPITTLIVGNATTWGEPGALKIVSTITTSSEPDKYLSPFTGKLV